MSLWGKIASGCQLWSGLQLNVSNLHGQKSEVLVFPPNPLFPNLAVLVSLLGQELSQPSPGLAVEHGALWSPALSSAPACPWGCLALEFFSEFPIRFEELCVDGIIPCGNGKVALITIITCLSSNRLWGLSFWVQVSGGAWLNFWGVQGRGFGVFSAPGRLWGGAVIVLEQQRSWFALCQFPAGIWDQVCALSSPREAPGAVLHPLGGFGSSFREAELL